MLEKLEEKYGLLMNRKEICKELKISLSTFKRWEKDGKILAVPLGGREKKYSTENVLKLMQGDSNANSSI